MRRILLTLLLLAHHVGLAHAEEPIKIPVLVGLTGDASVFGANERDAYLLAADEFNAKGGKQVKLVFEDTRSGNAGTLSAFRKFHDVDGYKVVLGPTWADSYQGALPIAVRSKALLLTPSAEAKSIDPKTNPGPTLFTSYPSTAIEVRRLLEEAKKHGATKIAIISEEEPFFSIVRTLLQKEAKELLMTIVFDQTVQGATTDFRSFFVQMRQRRADAFFQFLGTQSSVNASLKQHAELAPQIPLYGTHDFAGFYQNSDIRPYLEGARFPIFKASDPSFAVRFEKRFGYAPILTASYAYDMVRMLLAALAQGRSTPEEIRVFLLQNEFETVSYGKVRYNATGALDAANLDFYTVRNGEMIVEH